MCLTASDKSLRAAHARHPQGGGKGGGAGQRPLRSSFAHTLSDGTPRGPPMGLTSSGRTEPFGNSLKQTSGPPANTSVAAAGPAEAVWPTQTVGHRESAAGDPSPMAVAAPCSPVDAQTRMRIPPPPLQRAAGDGPSQTSAARVRTRCGRSRDNKESPADVHVHIGRGGGAEKRGAAP